MKKIVFIAAMFGLASSINAFEWGINSLSTANIYGENLSSPTLELSENATLWTKTPLSKDNSVSLNASAFYKFLYSKPFESDFTNTNAVDIPELALIINKNTKAGKISAKAGRFSESDKTNLIFSQLSDGIKFKYSANKFTTSLYAGYTGLLNAINVTMLTPENSSYAEGSNDFYRLTPKYIPLSASITFPSLFANQQLGFEAYAFMDLNGDNYNRYYATLDLDGFLSKNLFYAISTTFGTANFTNAFNLSRINIGYSPCKYVTIFADGIYASGKQGFLSSFEGVSSMTADYSMLEPEYKELIKASLSVCATIKNTAFFNAGTAIVFDCAETNVSYKGFEWEASALWNIFSDLRLSSKINQFYGTDTSSNKTNLSVSLLLLF